MILSVCPNPCIDTTIEVGNLNVGRLTRVISNTENFAGKACNTAVGIARLGGNVKVSGFMFDKGGKRFCDFLDKESVTYDFIWNKGKLRTNYKIIDGKSMLTELNDSGDYVSVDKQKELVELVKKLSADASVVVISGSLPKGVEDSYYYDLTSAVKNGKVIIDCEASKMEYALKSEVYLVKPNLYELQMMTGETYKTTPEMLVGCNKLIDMGAKKVLLSIGPNGAILTDGTNSYYCRSGNVAVNSTVGAGDSMIAALSIGIEEDVDDSELLRRAVAAGTASVTTQGTNLFTKAKYDEIFKKLKVSKI